MITLQDFEKSYEKQDKYKKKFSIQRKITSVLYSTLEEKMRSDIRDQGIKLRPCLVHQHISNFSILRVFIFFMRVYQQR